MASLAKEYESKQAQERERMRTQTPRDENTARREYNELAPYYGHVYQHHAVDIEPFVSFADLQPGQAVLELGCGVGWLTVQAASRVGSTGRVVAIDASGVCLRQASTALTLAGVKEQVELLRGDMRKLDQFPTLKSPGFAGFDRILLCWVFQTIRRTEQAVFLRELASYLSPTGWIVFDQEHEHFELGCVDALPLDGSDSDGIHWLIGDGKSFKQTRQFAEGQVKQAGLQKVKTEDFYRDNRYGYEDQVANLREQAQIAWKADGGSGNECSRLYLEYFKRNRVTVMMDRWKKDGWYPGVKNVAILMPAKHSDLEGDGDDVVDQPQRRER